MTINHMIPEPNIAGSIPEKYRKLRECDKLKLAFMAVVVEFFIFFIFFNSDCYPYHLSFAGVTLIIYIALIITMFISLISLKVRKMVNLHISFLFMFFIPVQGYFASYDPFSGLASPVCIIMPLLTLLTLSWYLYDNSHISVRKIFVFFSLFLISLVIIYHLTLAIINYRFDLKASYFHDWYLAMVFFGILPYTIVFYRSSAKKGFLFTLIAGYTYLSATGELFSFASYFICNIYHYFGIIDNPMFIYILLSILGALVGAKNLNK